MTRHEADTERAATLAALRESEKRYRLLADTTSDLIYSYDTQLRLTGINRAAAQVLELDRDEALGKALEGLGFPGMTLPQWTRLTGEVLASRGPVREVVEAPVPDGEARAYELVLEPVLDASGEVAGVRVASRDVTEQERAQRSLRLIQRSVEDATYLVHWADSTGRILFVNDASCRRNGYSREEMLALRVFDLDITLSPAVWPKAWQRLKDADTLTLEAVHETKAGERYPVTVSATYVEEDGKEYVFAFARAASERTQAAEELREGEERLRLALVASHQGTWDLDLRTGQMLVSPQYALSLGHHPEDYQLTIDDSWVSLHPEDRDQAMAIFEAYLQDERPTYESEYRRATPSGEWKWFRALGMATERDERGRPLRMVGTQSDITEHKEAEKALRESEARLRQAQKMEAVGQLAGGIAHDFNNVLTVILGYSDMLLATEECAGGSLRGPVLEIKAAAERASTLTRQILAFSRRQALSPEVLSLNEVLEGIESLLRRTLGEDIDLAAVLHPDLGLVEVDAHQFEQVVMNLALNARDAMPRGGKLTLETANVELTKEYAKTHPGARPGAHVMLAVSDTGVGMDEETKSHLFEPFFTTKELGKGTGLGLASVYGVVKQSEGCVFVYSEPGQGSSFKIYLPRVGKPARRRAAVRRVSPALTGSETILVVEDEAGVRDLVRQVLERLGYQVVSAGSGDEALGFLKDTDYRVDLLLTDVVLPGALQGNELARAVSELRPALPVLYMSGYTRNAIVHAGRLDQGVDYIEKPFAPEKLAARVREVLDRRTPS